MDAATGTDLRALEEADTAVATAVTTTCCSAAPSSRTTTAGGEPMAAMSESIEVDITAAAMEVAASEAAVSLSRIPTCMQPDMPIRERLHHFTFAWYTVTMSTSGIALVIGITPYRFRGLDEIGLAIYLLDLLFFLGITAALCCRFTLHRRTFRRAVTHPSEALFISTFFLSIAALLSNAGIYGRIYLGANSASRAGLFRFLSVTYWIYLGATFAYAVLQYHILFSVKPQRRLTIDAMTPAWILPIFPVMLAGTLAGVVSPEEQPARALATITSGLAAQGLGFLVSVFMYATYLSRLMVFGLPAQRPGMFIAVGPPSFTCAAFVALASDGPRVLANAPAGLTAALLSDLDATALDTMTRDTGAMLALAAGLRLLALCSAVFLWGLSFWFFLLAAAAVAAGMPDRRFHLSWWSFVFPNAGLTIATIRLGNALGSDGVLWLATAMTVCLVAAWLFIAFRCVRAVIRREIMWPGHDEDKD